MLNFHFNLESGITNWRPCSRGWTCGNSSVTPFAHAALEIFALRSERKVLFVIREKINGNSNPKNDQHIHEVSEEELEKERFGQKDWPLTNISIVIEDAPDGKHIEIKNGLGATAPVFVIRKKHELWGHWDPTELYHLLPTQPFNRERVSHFLIGFANHYSKHTLFENLGQLTERATLNFSMKKSNTYSYTIDYPQSVSTPSSSRELKPRADVLAAFDSILSGSIQRWINKEVGITAEMSGGLDSGCVVAAASSLLTQPLHTCGVIVSGEIGESQLSRRNEIASQFELRDSYIRAKDHLPFAKTGSRFSQDYFVPWEECYYEAFDKMYEGDSELSNRLLFTGLGGDELFYPHWNELENQEQHRQKNQEDHGISPEEIPAYINHETKAIYYNSIATLDRAPRSIIPTSSLESAGYGDARLLRSGIWPAHPFCTPELIWFCRSLPSKWRKNRRLQRDFLTRKGCATTVTHPSLPETFTDVMAHSLTKSSKSLIKALLEDSYLQRLGYIDADKFLQLYNKCCRNGKGEAYYPGFYAVTILELTLRSIQGKKEKYTPSRGVSNFSLV